MSSLLRILSCAVLIAGLSSCATDREILERTRVGPCASQAILVRSDGSIFRARLTAWQRDTVGEWRKIFGPWPAVIGRNGFAPTGQKREGDGRTPSGVFVLGPAFGQQGSLPTKLEYRRATTDDVWVDDVNSPQYNQWVSGRPLAKSFEQMLRSDGLYDVGVVVGYNTAPVVPGDGSAIFLHIWRDGGRKPTAGCVALNKSRLLRLLAWLNAAQEPVIILGQ